MSKSDKKIELKVDDTTYKQIRVDRAKETYWKNIPQVSDGVLASGLHFIDKNREESHYDFFIGKEPQPQMKEYLKEPIRKQSLILNPEKGVFVAPNGKILVTSKESNIPTYISRENYEKNKEDYFIKVHDGHGNPVVVGIKPKKENKLQN